MTTTTQSQTLNSRTDFFFYMSTIQHSQLKKMNIVHFPCNYIIFTKNQQQPVALYYLFVL